VHDDDRSSLRVSPGLDDAIDIEIAAAQRLGMRVTVTRGSMNRSQRDGGLPPDSVVQDEDTILADSERLIARYHQTGPDALVQVALRRARHLALRRR